MAIASSSHGTGLESVQFCPGAVTEIMDTSWEYHGDYLGVCIYNL